MKYVEQKDDLTLQKELIRFLQMHLLKGCRFLCACMLTFSAAEESAREVGVHHSLPALVGNAGRWAQELTTSIVDQEI